MVQPAATSGQSGASSANVTVAQPAAQPTGGQSQADGAAAVSSGGGAVDYGALLAEVQGQYQHQSKTVDVLTRRLAENQQQLQRVRKAFVGEEEKAPTEYEQRIGEHNRLMDYFLQQGLEAERKGAPMPLTVTLGTKLAQLGIQAEERAQKLEQELAEIKNLLGRQTNAAARQTENAASIMDGMVQEAIMQMYGEDPAYETTRNVQYDAVCKRIDAEIRDLIQNEPKTWAKIRTNPGAMRKMVNHFMAEMIPPAIRAKMEHDKIMETPMSVQELWAAFNEARVNLEEANSNEDVRSAAHWSTIMDELRQKILAEQGVARRESGKPSLNRLMGGGRG